MYRGKSIKQANDQQYNRLRRKLMQKEVNLSNPPNPYDLIKQEQQRDRVRGKNDNIPYKWVKNQPLGSDNGGIQQNTNNSMTVSRVDVSRNGFNRQFNRNNHVSDGSDDLVSSLHNPETFQQREGSIAHERNFSYSYNQFQTNQLSNPINYNNNSSNNRPFVHQQNKYYQNSSLIQQLFDDMDSNQNKNGQYQIDRTVNIYQNHYQIRPKDIFKKQGIKQFKKPENQCKRIQKPIKNNQIICGLVECDKNRKLTSMKIFQATGPLVRNYLPGDVKMWQIDNKYPDHILKQALAHFPLINNFKNNQKAIIKCALNGNDVFTCIPTGGGKSLIFQIMTFIKKGIYLCILPLISLIYDQQMQAQKFNIETYSLTGATNGNKVKQIYSKISCYSADKNSILILCTPQKIGLSQNFIQLLTTSYNKGHLQHVIIDQVHCVSTWGKQFRKEYENLSQVKVFFPRTPILGLTATVTQTIKQQIIKKLKMTKCLFFQSSFNRPNLMYQVRTKTKKNAVDDIQSILKHHKSQSGIIYCLSKRECQQLCKNLNNRSYLTAFYHADLHDNDKRTIQQMWMQDKIRIIIATIAFGMGINKPDVRFVIHNSLSKSLQNYYQESGRAGRDGEPAKCILFYHRSDRQALQSMNLKNEHSTAASKLFTNRQLSQMVKYCQDIFSCRRQFQLNYLGETDFDPSSCNKTCDNCINAKKYREFQCITHGKQITKFLQFIDDKKQRITKAQIINMLKSKSNNKNNKYNKALEYPLLQKLQQLFKFWTIDQLQEIFLQLLSQQILKQTVKPTKLKNFGNVMNVYIECNISKCHKFLDKVQTLPMKRQIKPQSHRRNNSSSGINRQNVFQQLFGDDEQKNVNLQKQQIQYGSYTYETGTDSYDNVNFDQFQYDGSFQQRINEIRMENNYNKTSENLNQADFPINNQPYQNSYKVKIQQTSTQKDQARARVFDYISQLFDDQDCQI